MVYVIFPRAATGSRERTCMPSTSQMESTMFETTHE